MVPEPDFGGSSHTWDHALAAHGAPHEAMRAIFIGGVGRSGTTMLGSMLGLHPYHVCVPETSFKTKLFRLYDESGATGIPIETILRVLRHERKFKVFEIESLLSRQVREEIGYTQLMETIVRLYGSRVGKSDARVWIDHTPSNIRYAPELFNRHPGAQLVHIVRDGRAVVASVLPLDWGSNTIYDAARHWVEGLAYGLAAELWSPDRVVRVRYEDLVIEPGATLKGLCARLGIGYLEEMLTGRGFLVPRSHGATHALVGRQPDPTRIDSWRERLGRREIEIFESIAGPMLCYLGYQTIYGTRSRSISRSELWLKRARGWCKRTLLDSARRRRRRGLRGWVQDPFDGFSRSSSQECRREGE